VLFVEVARIDVRIAAGEVSDGRRGIRPARFVDVNV
jgi:hypothetical protein